MPEIQNLEVTPGEIKKGDLIDDVNTFAGDTIVDNVIVSGKTRVCHGHMVEDIKRGDSNVVLETTGGRIVLRRTSHEVVSIRREVETDEEKEAKQRAYYEEAVTGYIERMRRLAETDVRAEVVAKLSEATDLTYQLQWHGFGWMVAEAEAKHAANLVAMLNHNEVADDKVSEAEVLVAWVRRLEVDIVRHVARGSSRSTSAMSNLADDAEAKAAADLIDGMGAYGIAAARRLVESDK